MATTKELEQQLEKQQAGYLSRLEGAGQLPSVVSSEWQKAGGAETAKLRGEEAGLLTDYVSAGARGREKYKDVWDPFARERLATSSAAAEYKPIADIRSELAMRAEALGVATSSAQAMYGAETQRAETNLGFTESAYSRALAQEQEVTRQKEREQEHQWAVEENAKSRAASAAKSSSSKTSIASDLKDDIQQGISDVVSSGLPEWATEDLIKQLQQLYPEIAPLEIEKQVYDYRRPLEEQYQF